MRIEIFQDVADQWRWRFRSKGRIVATGESHPSRGNVIRAAKAVVRAAIRPLVAQDGYLPEPVFKMAPESNGVTVITWA